MSNHCRHWLTRTVPISRLSQVDSSPEIKNGTNGHFHSLIQEYNRAVKDMHVKPHFIHFPKVCETRFLACVTTRFLVFNSVRWALSANESHHRLVIASLGTSVEHSRQQVLYRVPSLKFNYSSRLHLCSFHCSHNCSPLQAGKCTVYTFTAVKQSGTFLSYLCQFLKIKNCLANKKHFSKLKTQMLSCPV